MGKILNGECKLQIRCKQGNKRVLILQDDLQLNKSKGGATASANKTEMYCIKQQDMNVY